MKKAQPLDAEELVPWVYAPQEFEEERRRFVLRRPAVFLGLTLLLFVCAIVGTLMVLHTPLSPREIDLTSKTLAECDRLVHQCKRTNDSAICDGKGTCLCGICVCDQRELVNQHRVTGKFCECDNSSCPVKGNEMCSGNGQCNCGHCICEIGYTGKDCSIGTDGAHLALKHCDAYKDCVLCHPSKSDPATKTNCLQCPQLAKNVTESLLEKPNDEETAIQPPCILVDPIDSCAFKFIYVDKPEANITTVLIQKDILCDAPIKLQ